MERMRSKVGGVPPCGRSRSATSGHWAGSRFLQIRLGNESCDQISASPKGPKRAKSRDSRDKSRETCDKTLYPPSKTKEVYFVCVQTLIEFNQINRYFPSFFITKHTNTSNSLGNSIIVYATI